MNKNLKILIVAFLEISIMVASVLLIINLYDQQFATLRDVNANLKANGVFLSMPESNPFKLLGNEYEKSACTEGHKDIYKNLAFTAIMDKDAQKVKAIITQNDKHSLYDIKAGKACEKAEQILTANGFLNKTDNAYQYIKDDVTVTLIYNEDKKLKGFMVESLSV
jgi:hypothetical protein